MKHSETKLNILFQIFGNNQRRDLQDANSTWLLEVNSSHWVVKLFRGQNMTVLYNQTNPHIIVSSSMSDAHVFIKGV